MIERNPGLLPSELPCVTVDLRVLAIVMAALASAPVAAQTQNPAAEQAAAKEQQVNRAKERCTLNHGVDCDSPKGQEEWLMQGGSRSPGSVQTVLPADPTRSPVQAGPAQTGSVPMPPGTTSPQPAPATMSRP